MIMRPVVIEIDKKGNYKLISVPKKVQVIIRHPKKKPFKKRIRTLAYQVKSFMGIQ
jgi:hypothetical protein